MLTRNFMQMFGLSSGMGLSNTPAAVNTQGIEISATIVSFGASTTSMFGSVYWANSRFALGTGTTAPKSTDYKVETEITNGFDCSVLTKRYVQGADKDYINISGEITNNGSSDITFSEVGWYSFFKLNSNNYEAMLAREVLENPITIKPGESVAINVNLM